MWTIRSRAPFATVVTLCLLRPQSLCAACAILRIVIVTVTQLFLALAFACFYIFYFISCHTVLLYSRTKLLISQLQGPIITVISSGARSGIISAGQSRTTKIHCTRYYLVISGIDFPVLLCRVE